MEMKTLAERLSDCEWMIGITKDGSTPEEVHLHLKEEQKVLMCQFFGQISDAISGTQEQKDEALMGARHYLSLKIGDEFNG